MNTVKEKTEKSCTQEFLCELYKNIKMGSDSIINIMPKVDGKELRQELTAELNRYEEFAKEIAKEIYDGGEEPKEENQEIAVAEQEQQLSEDTVAESAAQTQEIQTGEENG